MGSFATDAKWASRFLDLSLHVAQWSKHPTCKVGAVIVRPDRTVASMGFNGPPRGVSDRSAFQNGSKHSRTIHAELNAILSSAVSVRGYELYCSMPICDRCACHVIQAGITRVSVIETFDDALGPKWAESFAEAKFLFDEAGIVVTEYMPMAGGLSKILDRTPSPIRRSKAKKGSETQKKPRQVQRQSARTQRGS
ncbi:deaminase [Hyphomicrobium sp.]|uniref:deoxycytidylate deaminase n=1 Tax=Hyphomicrobium sp. TaxID=82 RepID=UPI001DD8AC6A|nr:deaminase [Hyphomicrobium sp.]MBY0559917.1 hypothetical protein [Hyphomicrobium sp.]